MIKRNDPRVLYFTAGADVTEEDQNKALALGYNVGIRNAKMVGPKDSLEDTDAVAGEAPVAYRKVFPYVKDAAELKEAVRRVKNGTYRFPSYDPDPNAGNAVDLGNGTWSEDDISRLSGESIDPGFDRVVFLEGRSDDFKAGYAVAEKGGSLPTDANDDFSAGFNAFDHEDDVPVPAAPTPPPAPEPAPVPVPAPAPAPAPEPVKASRGRKAAAPTPAPASAPTWNK